MEAEPVGAAAAMAAMAGPEVVTEVGVRVAVVVACLEPVVEARGSVAAEAATSEALAVETAATAAKVAVGVLRVVAAAPVEAIPEDVLVKEKGSTVEVAKGGEQEAHRVALETAAGTGRAA